MNQPLALRKCGTWTQAVLSSKVTVNLSETQGLSVNSGDFQGTAAGSVLCQGELGGRFFFLYKST